MDRAHPNFVPRRHRPFIGLSKLSALAVIAAVVLTVAGCAAVSGHWLDARFPNGAASAEGASEDDHNDDAEESDGDAATDASARPGPARHVLLITVEGLRADVLNAYLYALREADFEPDWLSGLAMLGQRGFRLIAARRSESPGAVGGLAAHAALVTGQYPSATGLPGTRFHTTSPDGPTGGVDLSRVSDAAEVFFLPDLELPRTGGLAPAASRALRAPTVFERLTLVGHGPSPAVAIMTPFGRGSRWVVPDSPAAGTSALLHHPVGYSAVPLIDRAARNAAREALLAGPPPPLMAVSFRGVLAASCDRTAAACAPDADLRDLQREALREVDAHLARVLRVWIAAHPSALDETTVMLTGVSGVEAVPTGAEHSLTPDALVARLAAHAPDECPKRLLDAARTGALRVGAVGPSARFQIPLGPAGQRLDADQLLTCLAGALERATLADPAIAATAWIPAEAQERPAPRAGLARVRLNSGFFQGLPRHRHDRARRKLRLLLEGDADRRGGDAVVVLSAPWRIESATREGPPQRAISGGLEAGAAMPGFLIASRALSERAQAELRNMPVEVVDIAPTILAVLDAPAAAFEGLPRPPLVRWRSDPPALLDPERADRRVPTPPRPVGLGVAWRETATRGILVLEEPAERWPPDEVSFRLGATTIAWDPDAGTFPEGSDCVYQEQDGVRRWRCALPLDRGGPDPQVAVIRRAPSGEDGPDAASPFERIFPVLPARTPPPSLDSARLLCADATRLRVAFEARAPAGLARLEAVIFDAQSEEGVPTTGAAMDRQGTVELGWLSATDTCDTAALDPGCQFIRPATVAQQTADLPLPAIAVRHVRRALRLPAAGRSDTEALRRAFAAARPDAAQPEVAYLALRLCDVDGQCVTTPLVGDLAYLDLVAAGCP